MVKRLHLAGDGVGDLDGGHGGIEYNSTITERLAELGLSKPLIILSI